MRQRIKVAGALVHDPDVILMDEPLNGTDPVQRAHLIRLIRDAGGAGKTVLVSSHVLVEVERFAENILVIVNGKLAAAGDFRAIRDKIDAHDHAVRIRVVRPAAAGGGPDRAADGARGPDRCPRPGRSPRRTMSATFYRVSRSRPSASRCGCSRSRRRTSR